MKWELAKMQTFGIEIEMNHIGRQRAAEIVADHYGTINSVHYTGGGYSAYECKDRFGRTWKFMTDASIDGARDQQCEMVTPICTYDQDMIDICEILRKLRAAGAISNPDNGCGVHIHIGIGEHTGRTLRNLANLFAGHEALLINSIGIDPSRYEIYCKRIDREFLARINGAKKPESIRDMQKAWYNESDESRLAQRIGAHYDSSRYRMLNYHSIGRTGTIEFRLFQFDNPTPGRKNGLHAGVIKSYIQLALVLSQQAIESRSISCHPVQMENQRFAMRTWMNRMGMIGEEFKTAHEIFGRKLSGDAAFRYGRPV